MSGLFYSRKNTFKERLNDVNVLCSYVYCWYVAVMYWVGLTLRTYGKHRAKDAIDPNYRVPLFTK